MSFTRRLVIVLIPLAIVALGVFFYFRSGPEKAPSAAAHVLPTDPVQAQESWLKEWVGTLAEVANVLETIKDRASAKEASTKLAPLAGRVETLVERYPTLPALTPDKAGPLTEKYMPEMIRLQQKMMQSGQQAQESAQGEPEFMKSLMRIAQATSKLQPK